MKIIQQIVTLIVGSDKMIGKILRTMRKKSNLTQSELEKICKIGRASISLYELEDRQPTFETINKIANTCGYKIIFVNSNTNDTLSVNNIDREEL